MKKQAFISYTTALIALVWIINGIFCKVLALVPRHQAIVEKVLNIENARMLTILIGSAETAMATWILLGIWSKAAAIVQIITIASMNILEFFLAPELLLWGKTNLFFAFLFIVLIYYKEFYLKLKPTRATTCYHS